MNLLAFVLQSDSSPQFTPEQQHALAGLGVGFAAFIGIFLLALFAFLIFLLWRIFTKAGLSGALSLLVLLPGIGSLVVLCILAFAKWNVVPVALAPTYPAAYPPPPPSYPATYPTDPPSA